MSSLWFPRIPTQFEVCFSTASNRISKNTMHIICIFLSLLTHCSGGKTKMLSAFKSLVIYLTFSPALATVFCGNLGQGHSRPVGRGGSRGFA